MPLEDIVKWLIIAIIIIVLLFVLLRIVGVNMAILPSVADLGAPFALHAPPIPF